MVDLIKEILIKVVCYECVWCGTKCADYEYVENHIKEGIEEWLSSFDAASATKCFEAVNILKKRLEDKDV